MVERDERWRRENDSLVDRKGVLRRGAALFLRYVAARLDARDVLGEHVQALVNLHVQYNTLPKTLLAALGPKTGTVLVLWHAGLREASAEHSGPGVRVDQPLPFVNQALGPGCISRTFDLPLEGVRDAQIECYRAIPEGAWVVAHDCVLTNVHIGAESHDLGPIPRGKLVQLRKPIGVGDRLHLQLQRDPGQLFAGGRYAG